MLKSLKASTPEHSNIRVVRRGEKAKSAESARASYLLVLMQTKCLIMVPAVMYRHRGDVVVTRGNQTLMAPRIEGNTKHYGVVRLVAITT